MRTTSHSSNANTENEVRGDSRWEDLGSFRRLGLAAGLSFPASRRARKAASSSPGISGVLQKSASNSGHRASQGKASRGSDGDVLVHGRVRMGSATSVGENLFLKISLGRRQEQASNRHR
jgi:hypothetical protein